MNVNGVATTFGGPPNLGSLVVLLLSVGPNQLFSDGADKNLLVGGLHVAGGHGGWFVWFERMFERCRRVVVLS